jgi:hypothetical protein
MMSPLARAILSMKNLKNLLASAWIDTAMGSIVSHAEEPTAPPVIGLRDFDFLVGEWRVHHHYLSVKGKQS